MLIPTDTMMVTGFLGVELFFFVSGFCLTQPYVVSHFRGEQLPSAQTFFKKRFRKIYPSYLVALIASVLLFNIKFRSSKEWLLQIFTHLTFTHSFYPQTIGTFFGTMWSLAIEFQFYVLFIILIRTFLKHPIKIFVTVTLLSLDYRYYFITDGNLRSIWMQQLPAYLDLFFAGMLTSYFLTKLRYSDHPWLQKKAAFTFAASIMLISYFILLQSYYAERYDSIATGNWLMLNRTTLSFVFMGFTISAHFGLKEFVSIVANRLMRFLSGISYNLYLWHQGIGLFLIAHHWPAAGAADPHTDTGWKLEFLFFALVISFFVAMFMTEFVEKIFTRPRAPQPQKAMLPPPAGQGNF